MNKNIDISTNVNSYEGYYYEEETPSVGLAYL